MTKFCQLTTLLTTNQANRHTVKSSIIEPETESPIWINRPRDELKARLTPGARTTRASKPSTPTFRNRCPNERAALKLDFDLLWIRVRTKNQKVYNKSTAESVDHVIDNVGHCACISMLVQDGKRKDSTNEYKIINRWLSKWTFTSGQSKKRKRKKSWHCWIWARCLVPRHVRPIKFLCCSVDCIHHRPALIFLFLFSGCLF